MAGRWSPPAIPNSPRTWPARAGSVSHGGEAVYGAQCLAAMEAQAFVESDINKLIDTGLSVIPGRFHHLSTMINDIRDWHAKEPDWRKGRELLAERYGYHIYGGNCHMVPNHGLMIFSLLYGDDDFQRTLMIVNTSGWDTDCNSGNIGCLMGIKDGLAGLVDRSRLIAGPSPIRMYIPTADGGNAVTDARHADGAAGEYRPGVAGHGCRSPPRRAASAITLTCPAFGARVS